ncbi:MAG TPA: YidB family protein [Hydrogenophaga sp.]|nr:YidB family protein [Hydrogenophaga sp.]
MGLLDALIGAAGNAARAPGGAARTEGATGATGGLDPQMLMGIVMALINQAGGLQGLLAKLQAGGLGEATQSWVGTGANQSVAPDQLGSALGPDLMAMIARQMGGDTQQASSTIAELLPELIDRLTPQGQLPADNGLGGLGALLGGGAGTHGSGASDLVGMLGGLMGRR